MPEENRQGFVPFNKWLHLHDEAIRKEFPQKPTAELAEKYGLNYYTVSRKATRMGVGKSFEFMHTSWKKGATSQRLKGDAHKQLVTAAYKYMKEHFHDTSNMEIAKMFCVDVKTVRRWARRLGLQKSDEFMHKARSGGRKAYYTAEYIAWRNKRIAEVYPDGDEEQIQQLIAELGIKRKTLEHMTCALGLKRSPERIAKNLRARKKKYSKELLAAIAEYHRNHSNKECAEKFGIPCLSLRTMASQYGWKKDREYISRLHSEQSCKIWQKRKANI